MGEVISARTFSREDRQLYRDKVHRCLDVLARMLAESRFDFDRPLTGMEVELNLVDDDGRPSLRNAEVLARIDDPSFVQELGRFNLEINVPPRASRVTAWIATRPRCAMRSTPRRALSARSARTW